MEKLSKDDLIKRANTWAWEAQWAARKWREDSWRCCEQYDGGESSWTQSDWDKAIDAGVDPITTNRVFPAVNKLLGSQIVGRFEIIAKGRTQKDSEISQVMSEAIKFVMDQWYGEFLISMAYSDSVIPGFGCLSPCYDQDPQKEPVGLKYRDWKTVWWDPFSPPWWSPEKTRYVFEQPWVDLEDFQALYPEKKKEIKNAYDEIAGEWKERGYTALNDEAQLVEENVRTLAGADWIDAGRKRIRPIEMWYTVNEMAMFALYSDGRCYEITKELDPVEAFKIIDGSQQVLKSMVKKMRVMTFFGEHLLLHDSPSPYRHGQYPLVPFVGYIDRWGFPYGLPKQVEGQSNEVQKRRSMALAMLQKRRVIAEKSVVHNGDKDALDALYEEANKLDGFMLLEDGGMNKFKIEELAQLSQHQMALLQQSEFEIRDIMGSDSPYFAGERAQSGVAKQEDSIKSATTTASLMDNLRRSMGLVGYQLISNIQNHSSWKYEKVLRVTDRLTGAERFVTVNQPGENGIELKNNITQGKYDCVVSEVPMSDTMRERYIDLLYTAIQKSPPEAVPTLLIASFEMSDLPNKETLIEKLKPILGVRPDDENMSPEQVKQRVLQELESQKEQQSIAAQMEQEAAKLELNKRRLENAKIEAEIAKIKAEVMGKVVQTQIDKEDHAVDMDRSVIEGIERGIGISERLNGDDAAAGKSVRGQS